MQTRDATESIDLFGIPGDIRISAAAVLAFESNDPSEETRKHLLAIVDRDACCIRFFGEWPAGDIRSAKSRTGLPLRR